MAMQIGINVAHIGQYKIDGTKQYGQIDAIFASLKDFGADFVRQPGYYDLIPLNGESFPLPVDMESWVTTTFKKRIGSLLNRARSYDVPVVLTFFTLGGGGVQVKGSDPDGTIVSNSAIAADFSDVVNRKPTIKDLVRGNSVAFPSKEPKADWKAWYATAFDPREEWQLIYVQNLAYYMAKMLIDLADNVMGVSPTDFDGALVAIEIYNELNACNHLLDGTGIDFEATGEMWASAVFYALEGFNLAYTEAGHTLPELWWPSLASENKDQTLQDAIKPFHAALVKELVALTTAAGGPSASLLTGQDTHWYRFLARQEAALALTMIDVVKALSGNFSDYGLSPEISICETGATMTRAPADADYPEYVAKAASIPGPESELFQAREVVRRLAAASCSGARRAAWHSHMGLVENTSTDPTPFQGTGLRNDSPYTPPAPTARDAYARLSMWTFARWQLVMGGRTGSVVYPIVSAKPPAYHGLNENILRQTVVILRFPGYKKYTYAWLMFVDSAYKLSESIDITITCASGTNFLDVPLIPSARSIVATKVRIYFPKESATFDTPTAFSVTGTEHVVTLGMDADPVLYYTDGPLSFKVPK